MNGIECPPPAPAALPGRLLDLPGAGAGVKAVVDQERDERPRPRWANKQRALSCMRLHVPLLLLAIALAAVEPCTVATRPPTPLASSTTALPLLAVVVAAAALLVCTAAAAAGSGAAGSAAKRNPVGAIESPGRGRGERAERERAGFASPESSGRGPERVDFCTSTRHTRPALHSWRLTRTGVVSASIDLQDLRSVGLDALLSGKRLAVYLSADFCHRIFVQPV